MFYMYVLGALFLYGLVAMVIYQRHLMRGHQRTRGLQDVTDRQYLFSA